MFFCIFLAQEIETFVYWLCITEFILNNAHHTQNDHLASAATEQRLELQQGSYIRSLRGTEARASMASERLVNVRWTKQAVHLICMASVYQYSMLFLATSCLLYADTVPLITSLQKIIPFVAACSLMLEQVDIT